MGYGSRALVFELIHPYGFTEKQVDEVIRLAGSPTGLDHSRLTSLVGYVASRAAIEPA